MDTSLAAKKKSRSGMIDLVRFIASLFIMSHHLYTIGYVRPFPGYYGWVWVEFFFFVTGYFTAKHYKIDQDDNPILSPGKTAISYTLSKFKPFLPYTTIAVLGIFALSIRDALASGDLMAAINDLTLLPYELSFLSVLNFPVCKLVPIWFLSAMLLVLPVVVYVMLKHKDFWRIACWLIPAIYYGTKGMNTRHAWPNNLLRAAAALCLGTLIYYLVQRFSKVKAGFWTKLFLTVCEVGALGTAIVFSYKNLFPNFFIFLFVLMLVIIFSEKSFTVHIRGRFFTYLGKLSFPIFMFQTIVSTVLAKPRFDFLTLGEKTGLYYGITILLSIIAMPIVEGITKHIRKKKEAAKQQEKALA